MSSPYAFNTIDSTPTASARDASWLGWASPSWPPSLANDASLHLATGAAGCRRLPIWLGDVGLLESSIAQPGVQCGSGQPTTKGALRMLPVIVTSGACSRHWAPSEPAVGYVRATCGDYTRRAALVRHSVMPMAPRMVRSHRVSRNDHYHTLLPQRSGAARVRCSPAPC